MSPFEKIHNALNGKGPDDKGYCMACCPAHDDKNASLSYRETEDGGVSIHCFAGCERGTILASLKLREADMHSSKNYKPAVRKNQPPLTVIELAIAKSIHYRALLAYGVTDGYKYTTDKGRFEALRIAYKHRDGSEHTKIRVRYGISGHDACYVKESPGQTIPYGLWKLEEAEQAGYLLIGEGESDAWTCWYHNIPFLGIPGATNTACLDRIDVGKELASIPRLYVLQEPDQAERAANLDTAAQGFYASVYKRLRDGNYPGEIYYVDYKKLTGYKDPNEMHKALFKDKTSDLFQSLLEEALQKASLHEEVPDEEKSVSEDEHLDALRAAIDQAETPLDERIAALWSHVHILASLDTKNVESWLHAIKNAFGKEVNLNQIRKEIASIRKENEEKCDLDTVASLFAEQYAEQWSYDAIGQTWRKWVGTHWSAPVCEEDGKTEIDQIIVQLLHTLSMEIRSNGTLDCVHRLAKGKCKRLFTTRAKAVNFANGTLTLDTNELQAHKKEDNFLYCLEYPYDFTGDYPQTRETLKSILCVERINDDGSRCYEPDYHAIQALMTQEGLALIRDTKLHNSISLYGAKRAGKSTLMRHANSVCGNVTPGRVDPTDKYGSFAGDDLFSGELEGKRTRFIFGKQTLVCADEIRPEAIRDNEGIYKDMAAHSGVPMRGIMKDDLKDNTWRPKLIMSVNEIPHYRDTSGAIAERTIYLHTPLTRQKEGAFKRDLNLLEKIVAENGAYARDCIKLALAALERSYFPMSAAMKQWTKIAETNGNALKAFIDEKCVLEPDAKTHTDTIYQAFLSFRENNGHDKRYAKPTLTLALREMNIGISSSTNAIMIDGEQKRGLYGIRLKTEGEVLLPSATKEEKNDPLLLALPGLTQVDDLTTHFSGYQPHRQPSEMACEAVSLSQVDDLTTKREISPVKGYLTKAAYQMQGTSIESNDGENRVKPSTFHFKQPVEPLQGLTTIVNRSSTGRQPASTYYEEVF